VSEESPAINLERSELRYIFYTYDQENLIKDFIDLGFRVQVYEESPITRTIYFGSITGLERGMSLKARIYTKTPIKNLWKVDDDTEFQLLEIKSTISNEELLLSPDFNLDLLNFGGLLVEEETDTIKDTVFRIQRASEDGLLKDSTLKMKSRLSKGDLRAERAITQLTLREIVTILTSESDLDTRLSDDVLEVLNEKIRPKYKKKLVPLVITQYSRLHLVPENPEWADMIRITIDPGVDYYNPILEDSQRFPKTPAFMAEFLYREQFSRLEFKIDYMKMSESGDLGKNISSLLKRYGCLATISKKWSGITAISEHYIKQQALWREPLHTEISGFFPVDLTWYVNGFQENSFLDQISGSSEFQTYEKKKKSRILVKNENFVQGLLGMPIPSLIINIDGPEIRYELPPKSYPVKLIIGSPEFYIIEENDHPVRSTLISSKAELDNFLHPAIEVENNNFFRSYGFLVKAIKSDRVYKLTIEQKVEVSQSSEKNIEIYCKMRYLGSENHLNTKDKNSIFDDLQLFYDEFANTMQIPLLIEQQDTEEVLKQEAQ
jgi:hypothetical protein